MRTFKFFWTTHKWTGIVLSALFAMTSATGFLLLVKKDYAWIQPPTETGGTGAMADFIPFGRVVEAVIAQGHPDFGSEEDIDRIDVRPGKRVLKVRSIHNHSEIQVDAVTGAVLSVATRRSDLLEQIHDGSFFGDWAHGWIMPVYAFAMMFMVFSGLWLWIEPAIRRRRRQRRGTARRAVRTSG